MPDLLQQIQTFFNTNYPTAKAVEIIDDVDTISNEAGFPAIALIDAGFINQEGASEGLLKEKISLCLYSEYIGDPKEAVLFIRKMRKECCDLIRVPENFHSTGPFAQYNTCQIKQGSPILRMTREGQKEENSFILVKLVNLEFHQVVEEDLQ
jgi:hypothetical protein